jgi:hypothetical protein
MTTGKNDRANRMRTPGNFDRATLSPNCDGGKTLASFTFIWRPAAKPACFARLAFAP